MFDDELCSVKRTIVHQSEDNHLDDDAVEKSGDGEDDRDKSQSKDSRLDDSLNAGRSQGGSPTRGASTPDTETSWNKEETTTAAQDFAARAVQKAYRDWREMRVQYVKGFHWKPMLPDTFIEELDDSSSELKH